MNVNRTINDLLMRIGIISTLGGGLGRITNYLIEGLIRQTDVQIDLYLVDKRIQFIVPDNYRVVRKNLGRTSLPLFSKALALGTLAFKSLNVAVIHCNYISNTAFLFRYHGNTVLTLHGPPRPQIETSLAEKMAYKFEDLCADLVPKRTKIVSISGYCKNEIKKSLKLESTVIYNGVDCNFYKPLTSEEKLKLKNRLGYKDKRIILFVGRLHPIKDPFTLLEAFKLVRESISNVLLIVVGNGPLKSSLERIVREYSLPVTFIDASFGRNLLHLYQIADLFVLPSSGESFGLSLAEAMASGCPCVATDSGAFPELIDRKDLLVEPKCHDDLARRMIYILENKYAAMEYSQHLHKRAVEHFSLQKMAEQYYNLYSQMSR